MCDNEYKDRFGTRTAPAAAATVMLYSSLKEYLEIVSHPNSYAGYIEIAAAQLLYNNIFFNVVVAGTAVFHPITNPPLDNKHVIRVYHPHAMHFPTLPHRPTLNSAWYVLRRVQNPFLRHLRILIKMKFE